MWSVGLKQCSSCCDKRLFFGRVCGLLGGFLTTYLQECKNIGSFHAIQLIRVRHNGCHEVSILKPYHFSFEEPVAAECNQRRQFEINGSSQQARFCTWFPRRFDNSDEYNFYLTTGGGERKGRFFMKDRNTQLPSSLGAGESWVCRGSICVRVAGKMVCCSYSLKLLINLGMRSGCLFFRL